jgi:hypothetical protein
VRSGKIRTIIRTKEFDNDLARLIPSIKRADEFLAGAEIILARAPDEGCQLDHSSVWFVCGHTVDTALYYTFDDNFVYFLSIEKTTLPEL